MATDAGHMQMEPSDMSDKHSNANTELSNGVHRKHQSAANEYMPRSIWQPGVVKRLADYIKQLREVDNESFKPNVTSEQHTCPRHPERSCNCPSGTCADDDTAYRYVKYVQRTSDFYTCPISGSICLGTKCREWCESGVDRTKT